MKRLLTFSSLAGITACSIFTDLDGFTGGTKDGINDTTTRDGSTADGPTDGLSDANTGEGGAEGGAGEPLLVIGGGYQEQFVGPAFDTTYTAVLHADGTIGEWKPGPKLPVAASTESRVTAANGSVFFLFSDQATSAKRMGDGLGNLAPEPAPKYREEACSVGMGQNIFRLGGKIDGNAQDLVDAKDDTFTNAWVETTKLPGPRWLHGCAANESVAFVVAGKNLAGEHQSSVYVSQHLGATLSGWTTTKPLPTTGYWPRPVVVGSRLFVVGGDLDGKDTNTIYLASFTMFGELNDWQLSPTPLPVKVSTPGVASFGDTIVVTGGADSSTGKGTSKTFTTKVDPTNGALSPWVESTPLPVPVTQQGLAILAP